MRRPRCHFGASLVFAAQVVAVAALLVGAPRVATAHAFDPALLTVRELGGGRYEVRFRLPPTFEGRDGVPVPRLPCATVERPGRSAEEGAPRMIDCGVAGLAGQVFSVDGLDGRTDVLLRVEGLDGGERTWVLRAGAEKAVPEPVPVARAVTGDSTVGFLGTYGALGVRHILGGADHLLFLGALLLLVTRLRALAAAITAFTVAHSITLALATLGLVHVPPPPVEALIAASVALLAGELAREGQSAAQVDAATEPPATLTRRVPAVAAFAFGLLHGLGFAGALGEVGLPAAHIPLALLGFNLGVEAGQLLFIAAALLPLWAWRRWARGRGAIGLVPSYAIGATAAAWFFERLGAVLWPV